MTTTTAVDLTRRAAETLLEVDLQLIRAEDAAVAPAAVAWLEEDFTRKQALLALCPCGCEDADAETTRERLALQASVFPRPICEEGSVPGECITDEGDGECFCERWWISGAPGDCRDEDPSVYRPSCERRRQQLTVTGVNGVIADYLNEQLAAIAPQIVRQAYQSVLGDVLLDPSPAQPVYARARSHHAVEMHFEFVEDQLQFLRSQLGLTRDPQS